MSITFSVAENTKDFCSMEYDDIDARAAGLLAGKFGKVWWWFLISLGDKQPIK